ncbi:MAG: type II toxin-antitoxin system VapC family toxin [Actinomycetia bacterium]|nr:type II toxin-antitoxin system VapC family toxin [Actinomycetes bacterium]
MPIDPELLIVDASTVVAVLTDSGELGAWAEQCLRAKRLLAPSHLLVEVTSALRRLELRRALTPGRAEQCRRRLATLPIQLVDFHHLSDRVWELRAVLTAYDAAYVALAELTSSPLATLDLGIHGAPGIGCVLVPLPQAT